MPKFYHIQRGFDKILDLGFIDNNEENRNGLFFSKKESLWYNIITNDSSKEYGGYKIYEISFPSKLYTLSFYPTTPKIIRITNENRKEYMQLIKSRQFYKIYKNPNVLGFDVTNFRFHGMYYDFSEEGIIKRLNSNIKICLKEVFYNS